MKSLHNTQSGARYKENVDSAHIHSRGKDAGNLLTGEGPSPHGDSLFEKVGRIEIVLQVRVFFIRREQAEFFQNPRHTGKLCRHIAELTVSCRIHLGIQMRAGLPYIGSAVYAAEVCLETLLPIRLYQMSLRVKCSPVRSQSTPDGYDSGSPRAARPTAFSEGAP